MGINTNTKYIHFYYDLNRLDNISDEIEKIIRNNESLEKDYWGYDLANHYSPETLKQLKYAASACRLAKLCIRRVDQFLTKNDGEEAFRSKFERDLISFPEDELNSYNFKC
jgi:hypothetical protein